MASEISQQLDRALTKAHYKATKIITKSVHNVYQCAEVVRLVAQKKIQRPNVDSPTERQVLQNTAKLYFKDDGSTEADSFKQRLQQLNNILKEIKKIQRDPDSVYTGLIEIISHHHQPHSLTYVTDFYEHCSLEVALQDKIPISFSHLIQDLFSATQTMRLAKCIHNNIKPTSLIMKPNDRFALTSFEYAVSLNGSHSLIPTISAFSSRRMREAAGKKQHHIAETSDDEFAIAAVVAIVLTGGDWFDATLNLTDFQSDVDNFAKLLLRESKVTSEACRLLYSFLEIPLPLPEPSPELPRPRYRNSTFFQISFLPKFNYEVQDQVSIEEMVAHLFEKILRTRVNYSIAVTHQRRIERSVLPLTLRYRCVVEVDNETGKVEDLLNFKFRNLPKTHRVQMTRYQPDPPPHRVTRQKYCPKDRQVLNIILQPGADLPRFLFGLKPRSRHVDYSAVALYVFKILLNVEVSKIDIKDTYSCLSPEFQMPKLPRSDSDKPFWFGVRFEERSLARKKQEILDAARKLNLGEQCHIYIVGSE